MKWGTCVHVMAGMMAGAAVTVAMETMGARKKRKLKRFCMASGRKMAEKAGEWLG